MNWYIALAPLALAVVVAAAAFPYIFKKTAHESFFTCPKCGRRFKATVRELVFGMKKSGEYRLICHGCGEKIKVRPQIEEKK